MTPAEVAAYQGQGARAACRAGEVAGAMRAPRPAHGVESMGATVLWIMAALGPRPCPYDEMTPAEGRLSAYYRRGMAPNTDVCRVAYLRRR